MGRLGQVFTGLGRLATRHPWLVILGWVVVSVLIVATAPKLSATSDQSEFLPEALRVDQGGDAAAEGVPAAERRRRDPGLRPQGREAADRGRPAPTCRRSSRRSGSKLASVFQGIAAQPACAEQAGADRRRRHGPGQEPLRPGRRWTPPRSCARTPSRWSPAPTCGSASPAPAAQALDSQEASCQRRGDRRDRDRGADPAAAHPDLPQRDPRAAADHRDRADLPGRARPGRRSPTRSST